MRKVLLGLVTASLLALGSAGRSASADNQGADWLAAGTGTLICCNQPMVHVNAQSGVGGVNARGHFWIRYPNGGADFGGHVVCLTVVANEAGMIGRIDDVNVAGNLALNVHLNYYIYISVNDNGSPGTADTVNFDPATQVNPGACPTRFETLLISQGNYVVHDKPVTDPLALDQLTAFLTQIEQQANDPYG